MTHDEALKSPLGKYLLRYCYCGPTAAGAPSSDTCRIHYALAGIDPVLKEIGLQVGELRSLLEYTVRDVSHREPPHTVDEMHLETPLRFNDNCLRCRIDKALGDTVAEKSKDGLQLGEARNLPYPKPIGNDDAIKPKGGCICGPEGRCDYHRVTDITMPLEKQKCEHCGQKKGWSHSPGCKNEPESVKFR